MYKYVAWFPSPQTGILSALQFTCIFILRKSLKECTIFPEGNTFLSLLCHIPSLGQRGVDWAPSDHSPGEHALSLPLADIQADWAWSHCCLLRTVQLRMPVLGPLLWRVLGFWVFVLAGAHVLCLVVGPTTLYSGAWPPSLQRCLLWRPKPGPLGRLFHKHLHTHSFFQWEFTKHLCARHF